MLRAPALLYRIGLGRLLGDRFLLLDHVGRRTGTHHRTVLEVVRYDPTTQEAVVLSGWGGRSDWYRNVTAAPRVRITIGRHSRDVVGRVLDQDEAFEVILDYERRHRWIQPVVNQVLTVLAGFDYDSSDGARSTLVARLPLVAFTPASAD